jgi:hypothetical protein
MKFTASTQVIKLISSYTISAIHLRLGDVKKAKTIKQINIYCNNRTVNEISELRNKVLMLLVTELQIHVQVQVQYKIDQRTGTDNEGALLCSRNLPQWSEWKKVKSQHVPENTVGEIKIDFPIPITARNLLIEVPPSLPFPLPPFSPTKKQLLLSVCGTYALQYAAFYENASAAQEKLICPRCNRPVTDKVRASDALPPPAFWYPCPPLMRTLARVLQHLPRECVPVPQLPQHQLREPERFPL